MTQEYDEYAKKLLEQKLNEVEQEAQMELSNFKVKREKLVTLSEKLFSLRKALKAWDVKFSGYLIETEIELMLKGMEVKK